jgi:hypothetical protein
MATSFVLADGFALSPLYLTHFFGAHSSENAGGVARRYKSETNCKNQ